MTVLFYGNALRYTKDETSFVSQESDSIRALFDELGGQFGEEFKAFLLGDETCLILVNGKGLMTTGGFDTKLTPGDRVEILPYVMAG